MMPNKRQSIARANVDQFPWWPLISLGLIKFMCAIIDLQSDKTTWEAPRASIEICIVWFH